MSLLNSSESFVAGNIANFVDSWLELTHDTWVISNVKGVSIPFISVPLQARVPRPLRLSDAEASVITTELQTLLNKGIIERVGPCSGQWISNIFIRPKPNGKFRIILDLTALNKCVQYSHFKMCSLQTALDMLRPMAWMGSVDLRDAYYSVPIATQDRKYLRFIWRTNLYEFTVMPNGLACAPRYFTKLLIPVFAQLREQGHECFPYIDDSFIISDNAAQCRLSILALCSALENLGFLIHKEKSVLIPARNMTFLGFKLDTKHLTVDLTEGKREKFSKVAHELSVTKEPTVRQVAVLVGLMVAYGQGVDYSRAHVRGLEKDKNIGLGVNKGNYEKTMILSDRGKQDIIWWVSHLLGCPKKVRLDPPTVVIYTDASSKGWGAHRDGKPAGGRWGPAELGCHINELELWAIMFGLKSLVNETNVHVKVFTDNTTAVAYVANMGGIRSSACNAVAKQIWSWAEGTDIWLTAAHVPGVDNNLADYMSRVFSDNTEWSLSLNIFNKICNEFGSPQVDLFATRLNKKVAKFVAWGPDPDAWAVNAFSLTWTNQFFYFFPPFSLVGRVLQKVLADHSHAIIVAPWWPSQAWFARLQNQARQALKFNKSKGNLIPLGNPQNKEDISRAPLGAFLF